MNSMLNQTGLYADFAATAQLKRQARHDAAQSLPAVARQFEAIFMQMMLKSMRAATPGDDLFGSSQMQTYRDMFDQQIALELSSQRGFGLAQVLQRQLQGRAGTIDDAAPQQPLAPPLRWGRTAASQPLPTGQTAIAANAAKPAPRTPATQQAAPVDALPKAFKGPLDFVRSLWRHAKSAAAELGVNPSVLMAQAALETGWGKHATDSRNLFGIKADRAWRGPQVNRQTFEFHQGVLQRERAQFRSYDSYAESFRDYVAFLRDNPRYTRALQQAGDPSAFMHALQDAGYATDPAYADKVLGIAEGATLQRALRELGEPDPARDPI